MTTPMFRTLGVAFLAGVVACSSPLRAPQPPTSPPAAQVAAEIVTVAPPPAPRTLDPCPLDAPRLAHPEFERSPGGTAEVSTQWLLKNRCNVRVVDIRFPREWDGPLGRLTFGERIPMDVLVRSVASWNPHEPVVLVCRSGYRSGNAVRMLEDLGFHHVASVAGGLITWRAEGLPVAVSPQASPAHPPAADEPEEAHAEGPCRSVDVEAHVTDPSNHRWTKVAGLMLFGTASCVDGRDSHSVVGTPGGDAGELLLLLSVLEDLRGVPLSTKEVDSRLAEHIKAFGRFYIHTDTHALAALGETLAQISAFKRVLGEKTVRDIEQLVRRPPRELEARLLDELTKPNHVGCGHLRLILEHAEEYEVRPALSVALLRAVFHKLWQGAPIDLVVLRGHHHERAVLRIRVDETIHAYTHIPTVTPKVVAPGHTNTFFVYHPEVSTYLRRESARHFLEGSDYPGKVELILDALDARAHRQLQATVNHLAARLPIFDVRFDSEGRANVVSVRDDSPPLP